MKIVFNFGHVLQTNFSWNFISRFTSEKLVRIDLIT